MPEYLFVYDHTVLKGSEETDPDPTEAILFFYPPTVDLQAQHNLCSQLMGVVKLLTNLLKTRPRIFHLKGGTVACIHSRCSTYTFAYFTSDPLLVSDCIYRQAEAIYRLMVFYHGCLNCIFQRDDVRESRIETLSQSIARYLAYVTSCGNSLLAIFSPIPQQEIVDSIVYQTVVSFLENCSGWPLVLGGCLFYKEKLVLSQLPLSVTSRLSLIKFRHINCTDESCPDFVRRAVLGGVAFPPGVVLLRCLISTEELNELIENRSSTVTSNQSFSGPESTGVSRTTSLLELTESAMRVEGKEKEEHDTRKLSINSCCESGGFVSMLVYIEAHSDILLGLVLHDSSTVTEAFLGQLHNMCFSSMGELERKLHEQPEDSYDDTPDGSLVYDSLDQSLTDNMFGTSQGAAPITYRQDQFAQVVGKMHSRFAKDPTLREIVMGSETSWFSGRKKSTKEHYEARNAADVEQTSKKK